MTKAQSEFLDRVLELMGNIPQNSLPHVAAALLEIERERLDSHTSKSYILDKLQVGEKEVARAYRTIFGRSYQPIGKTPLPRLTPDEVKEYFPAEETGIRYPNLHILYKKGWLDLGWYEEEHFVGRRSWDMYKMGVRKKVPLKRIHRILEVSPNFVQCFADSGVLPVEKRVGKGFVDVDELETFKRQMSDWITISEAARRYGIQREQLRHYVRRAGLQTVPYGPSILIRWSEVQSKLRLRNT